VAGSSDAPVIRASPLAGIRDVVLRRTGSGHVLGAGASTCRRGTRSPSTRRKPPSPCTGSRRIGTLEPGKLADFVVLDRNPIYVEPERIADIGVLAPIVGGRPAYQSAAIVPEA
jgi:predicted amidohydrolase YtcJ